MLEPEWGHYLWADAGGRVDRMGGLRGVKSRALLEALWIS